MDRIHELIEQITKELAELFPDMTGASIHIDTEGYRDVSVDKWDKGSSAPFDKRLRRSLLEQYKRADGTWSVDRSDDQNAFYEKEKVLLKEGA